MVNVQEIVDLWKDDQPKYQDLGEIVSSFIRYKITDYELLPEIQYRTKELVSIIKKVKKKQAEKEYSYHQLKDKLGLRIICTFQEDLEIVERFLNEYFVIVSVERKKENLDFDRLDYVSNHYDAKIKSTVSEFKRHANLEDFIFEIQVRTLNQHAWSNTAHSLSYKRETDLPDKLKRKVYRLLTLYELADDEFSSVNKSLREHHENIAYSLLRKLEGKFYKFAKTDYDREISLLDMNTILDYFRNDNIKKQQIINNIESFVISNEEKIQRIYNDNRSRFYEILSLSQPEIFLIWYMLQNHPFTIKDNWGNNFDYDDLEQIKVLWGSEL